MRCLYCGKQLALLRRLTGGGEFCSDAHKQSYQEEYNRLALSRLLQAQSKPGEIKISAKAPVPVEGLGQPLPPGASRRRSLPASQATPEYSRGPIIAGPVTSAPAMVEETVHEPIAEGRPVAREETAIGTIEETPTPEMAEQEPTALAGFSMETPSGAPLADGLPYVEQWLEVSANPLAPLCQAPNQLSMLSWATLVSLDIGPPAGGVLFPALETDVIPREFARAALNLSALIERSTENLAPSVHTPDVENQHPFSSIPTAELVTLELSSPACGATAPILGTAATPQDTAGSKMSLDVPFAVTATPAQAFPSALPIALDIRVSTSGASHHSSLNGALRFPIGVAFRDTSLLDLYPSGIDFPAEEAEVSLVAPWADAMFSEDNALNSGGESPLGIMESGATPREALQALSRLHQDLVEEQEPAEPAAEPSVAAFELLAEPAELSNTVATTPVEPTAAIIDISAEPVTDRPTPRAAQELFAIPLKTFPPSKPALAVETSALTSLSPEMPRLKGLPLRPKVAKTPPGFSPQPIVVPPKSPAPENKAKEPTPAQPRPDIKTKPGPPPVVKQPPVKSTPGQPAKPTQPGKPTQPVKPVQTVKPPQAAKPAQPVQTVNSSGPSAPTEANRPVHTQPATSAQPAGRETQPPADNKNPAAPPVAEELMPSFATLQPVKSASFGSLKVKLVIAILLVVVASGAYYRWASKSHHLPSAPAATEDRVGPSIMMGEGGWVEGWASDPNGSHAGRQITIYRPSLKLSDYRIEFKGEIDSKSIGWVFRALDPYNYYAMKLAIVAPGLSPKIALVKYSVVQGHETEVGRVPVNIDARLDTMFSVRVDVRGSKFSTYVQGQPVDVWTDEQLKSGGVGFLNERAERARIKSVSISYLTGGKN